MGLGIVSVRVGFALRSTEIKPTFFDLSFWDIKTPKRHFSHFLKGGYYWGCIAVGWVL